jgi:hypothetical protein
VQILPRRLAASYPPFYRCRGGGGAGRAHRGPRRATLALPCCRHALHLFCTRFLGFAFHRARSTTEPSLARHFVLREGERSALGKRERGRLCETPPPVSRAASPPQCEIRSRILHRFSGTHSGNGGTDISSVRWNLDVPLRRAHAGRGRLCARRSSQQRHAPILKLSVPPLRCDSNYLGTH